MKKADLAVERRQGKGKNSCRQYRRQGKIPAVLYGRGSEPISLAVSYQDFTAILHGQESRNTLLNLQIAGAKREEILSLPKAIQFHPVDGTVIHVDFQQIHLGERIHTEVPLHVVGASPGVKAGGILEHLTRVIEVECLPTEIPEYFEVDISELNIGDALHVSDLDVGDKVRLLTDPERTLVLVAAPTVEKAPAVEEVPEGEAPPEGEEREGEGEPEKAEAASEKKDKD